MENNKTEQIKAAPASYESKKTITVCGIIKPEEKQVTKSKDGHFYIRHKGAIRRISLKGQAPVELPDGTVQEKTKKSKRARKRDYGATKLAYVMGLIDDNQLQK